MLISLLAVMMKRYHGQRWHCESRAMPGLGQRRCILVATSHCVSLLLAVRLLGVMRKRRV
jgi:hypothetical protein